jgi:hypothetical protein
MRCFWAINCQHVPPHARVKTWRRLQQVGAVQARNIRLRAAETRSSAVRTSSGIRSEIVSLGGEATVFAADAISVCGTEDIWRHFSALESRSSAC